MKRVTGIGGIFFKAKNPKKLANWYKKHLGLPIDGSYGGYSIEWNKENKQPGNGYTIWSPFQEDTDYMAPSNKDFMFNFIVDDLKNLMKTLESEGIKQTGEIIDTEFGKFSWIIDPENNKVELWEPKQE
jgi:predicted enzyme related to lactoylglutathione lyase